MHFFYPPVIPALTPITLAKITYAEDDFNRSSYVPTTQPLSSPDFFLALQSTPSKY